MKNKYKGCAGTVVSILSASSFIICGTSTVNATDRTSSMDEVAVTVPVSCSLTGTVDASHTATIENGIYQNDIGETTFKVLCNDANGFAVYAVGYSDDTYGNTFMKPSNLAATNNINTGLATSGNTSAWAMKLTSIAGDFAPTIHSTEENSTTYSFTDYHTIPSVYTKVASLDSSTDAISGSSFKSTYAAYISNTQAADTYTGKVKYTVVHPADTATPTKMIDDLTYMQDFASLSDSDISSVFASMENGTIYSLIDNRDNRTYPIAKMKDGNIWMAENLDLGRTELSTDLTSENTNLAITVTAATFNSWKKTEGTATYDDGEFITIDGTDAISGTLYGTLYNFFAASAGTISGEENADDAMHDICPAGWRLPSGGPYGEYKALYEHYGSYELMRASISNNGAAFALSGAFFDTDAPEDLADYGYYWSSTLNNEYSMYGLRISNRTSAVSSLYSDTDRYYGHSIRCVLEKPTSALTVSYNTGVASVTINGEEVQDGGTIELYQGIPYRIVMTAQGDYDFSNWSATSGAIDSATAQATTFTIGSSSATITANAELFNGPNIQNLASTGCTTTPSKAKDIRDGHVYIIQRLRDGNCWMMENLDLGRTNIVTDLTSANTNLVTTVAAGTFNSWKKTSTTATFDAGEFVSVPGIDATSDATYGSLYNYYVASAGTIGGTSNNNNAIYDICPAGWRLPTGGDYGEFNVLYEQYSSPALMRTSVVRGGIAFTLAGYFDSYGSSRQQDYLGYYWSSTRMNSTAMSHLRLFNSSVSTVGSINRSSGASIRCVAKKTSSSLTVSYGTGVSSIMINGRSIQNGGTIELERGVAYSITMTPQTNYYFGSWSSTSGSLISTDRQETAYMIDSSAATLSANAIPFNGLTMQNLASTNCTTTASKVKDIRDEHIYTIQRLLDGNCWMMENLDLGRANLTTDLTSANTNLVSTVTASTFNGWKKTSATMTYNSGVYIPLTAINTYTGVANDSFSNAPYGTLYNYYAASAGTISGNNNSSNASYDICPAGWRLPTGGSSGEFQTLYDQYNSAHLMRAPISEGGLQFVRSGYINAYNLSSAGQGSYGNYWASTRDTNILMHILYFDFQDAFYPAHSGRRENGHSIRCILQ